MGEQSNIEENKRIIRSFYEYFNNREWEKVADLLNDDFRKIRILPENDGYHKIRDQTKRKFMLAIFGPKTRKKMKNKFTDMRRKVETAPKEGIINVMKITTETENIS